MNGTSPQEPRRRRRWRLWLAVLGFVSMLAGVGYGVVTDEIATSRHQARFFSRLDRELTYQVERGPSDAIRFPSAGPYDQRLGYVQIPSIAGPLAANGFPISAQARVSARYFDLARRGVFPIYHEKTQTGLVIQDERDRPLYESLFPERVFRRYEDIPAVVTQMLLYIENRELLDPPPTRNPAVEWRRFGNAVLSMFLKYFEKDQSVPGGSTLATQIEKYRHSPEGRTSTGKEKLQQMASASLRAYLDGQDTREARRRVVLDYVNSVPLAAAPGFGEVNGIGDGLWAWFGANVKRTSALLRGVGGPGELTAEQRAQQALALKQVLGLFLAQRRPSHYLASSPDALDRFADTYLLLLANDGIVPVELADQARAVKLEVLRNAPARSPGSFVERKAVNAIRTRLLATLGLPTLYDLDRFDLTVHATLDRPAQEAVTRGLLELRDPAVAQAAGIVGPKMLERGDPSKLIYSFTLYERVGTENRLRVQTDNYDQPLDINEGVKLELGSTAKLRTLVTYLEIIAALHGRFAGLGPADLAKVPVEPLDRLTQWAVDYLHDASDRSLRAMLEAAMDREYSASPAEWFFTGGGREQFVNFDKNDDDQVLTVREGIRNSVNLVFIRLMRDVVRYYMFHVPGSTATVLQDVKSPERRAYLEKFADQEGSAFLIRFYKKYEGKAPAEVLESFLGGIRPAPRSMTMAFRATHPKAGIDAYRAFMQERFPASDLDESDFEKLYETYDPAKFSLADQGYLIHVHPLELWLVDYLLAHPKATREKALDASRNERVAVYKWLFSAHRKKGQDRRIRTLLEVEAFLEIQHAWARLGYPFETLVPSYATAIGVSADKPAALAELMGILLADGMRYPLTRIEKLHFASGTPYETVADRVPGDGERVLAPEIATVARNALQDVVEHGTARRISGTFHNADGSPMPMGGKTGTGDNRYETFGRGGNLISSRVVNRTATFVFFIGDRFFGTLTAHVPGPEAGGYVFTSALPVTVLKALAPAVTPILTAPVADDHTKPAS